jgi:hypothetical protein
MYLQNETFHVQKTDIYVYKNEVYNLCDIVLLTWKSVINLAIPLGCCVMVFLPKLFWLIRVLFKFSRIYFAQLFFLQENNNSLPQLNIPSANGL